MAISTTDQEFVARFAASEVRFTRLVLGYAVPDVEDIMKILQKSLNRELLLWLYQNGVLTKLDILTRGIMFYAIEQDRADILCDLRTLYGHKNTTMTVSFEGVRAEKYGVLDLPINISRKSFDTLRELSNGFRIDIVDNNYISMDKCRAKNSIEMGQDKSLCKVCLNCIHVELQHRIEKVRKDFKRFIYMPELEYRPSDPIAATLRVARSWDLTLLEGLPPHARDLVKDDLGDFEGLIEKISRRLVAVRAFAEQRLQNARPDQARAILKCS